MSFTMGMGPCHRRTPSGDKQIALRGYRWRFMRALREGDLALMEDVYLDVIRVEAELAFLKSRGLS